MSVTPRPSQSTKVRAPRTAILHVSAELGSESPGREVVSLAILTQRSGWRALIASAGGRLVNEAERAAVRHKRIPLDRSSPFSAWRSRLHLKALIQKERPALLHAHGFGVLPCIMAINRVHPLPLIVDLTQPAPDHPHIRRLFESLKTTPTLIRVPSEFMGWHLHKTFGVDIERIHHIPPGVDLNWYSAGFISAERLQNLNQLWRLPEQASVVLASMPLRPEFGHKILLEAVAALKDEHIYVVLAGADGGTGLRTEIEALIEQLNLGGKVIMPEFCADLPAACWLSSVVVAPNTAPRGQYSELLAAQAIGRPVIVTDTGANREMVIDGETAWVIPPNDVQALAKALREAVHMTTDQRLALAESTHNFIAETFPQNAWFNSIVGLYESLLRPNEVSARSRAA